MSAYDARDVLATLNEADIADFAARVENERRRLYRTHLRCTVRNASPLLVDLLAAEGVAPSCLIDVMQPPPSWPAASWASSRGPSTRRLMPNAPRSTTLGARAADERLLRLFAYGGVLLRLPSDRAGGCGVWTSAGMMHGWIDFGRIRMVIDGGEAHLSIASLPETVALAMPGRDLDRLVSHPLIDGRGYSVRRVCADGRGTSVLVVKCGVQPLDLTRPVRNIDA